MNKFEEDDLSKIGEKTKQGLIWTTVGPSVFQIFRFVISIAIARILEPKDFGIMGVASIVIYYTNSLSNFGIGNALIQLKKVNNSHFKTFFSFNMAISLILAVMLCLSSGYLAYFFKVVELELVFKVVSLIFIITAFYAIPLALLRRNLMFKLITKIEIVKGFINIVTSLILAKYGFGYWSLVYGLLAGNLCSTIIAIFVSKWKPSFGFYVREFKEIINFSSWNFVSAQLILVGEHLDKFLIGKFLGPVQLGFYEKSFGISFMPIEHVSQKIGNVVFSTFSRVKTDESQLRYYFVRTLTINTLICFPVLIGLLSVADHFVIVLLGEKWAPMLPSYKILLFSFMFASLISCFNSLNLSCDNYKKQILARFFSLLCFGILLLLTVPSGIVGVSVSVLFYNLILFLCSYYAATKIISISLVKLIHVVLPAVLSSCLMYAVVKVFTSYLFYAYNLWNLVFLVFIGFLSYVIVVSNLKFKSSNFVIDEIKNKIKLKLNYMKK